jgi:hypothetical protein
MVKWLALAAVFVAACQGGETTQPQQQTQKELPPRRQGAESPPPDVAVVGSGMLTGVGSGSGSAGSDDGSEAPPDPGKQLDDLGAVPAWQAVVDRAHYLARRGQHGVVFGVLDGPVYAPAPPAAPGSGTGSGSGSGSAEVPKGMVATPFVWLVDDTEGNGALAIRVDLGKKSGGVTEGDRVALGGAWALDENRRWYWKVDNLDKLPPAKPSESKDAPSPPGHTLQVGNFPPGVKRISVAKDNDLVYFQVVGAPPAVDGDGWPVADELGNPVFALLRLPGERPSYGAQDMRTPDERWQLKRGQTYWLRIGRIHKHGPDKPATINARTAPVWVR